MTISPRDAGLKLLREHALIAGEVVTGAARIAVDDPATGEIIGHIPDLGVAQTQKAIAAAVEAFPTGRDPTRTNAPPSCGNGRG